MTKTDFLIGLQNGLEGQVDVSIIQESVAYYSQYIDDAITQGKTEAQVLEELGPVQLIVKTIIDANSAGRSSREHDDQETKDAGREKPKFHADVNDKGEFDIKYGKFSFNSWYGKLLLILLAVLVVALVIALIVGFFVLAWYLLPVILLIVILIVLAKLFLGRR